MNKQRRFYETQATALIQNLRRDKEISYLELARRLEAYGVTLDRQVLTNKLNRGRYSFAFALQVLCAMGETTLTIPQLPHDLRQRPAQDPPPTAAADES